MLVLRLAWAIRPCAGWVKPLESERVGITPSAKAITSEHRRIQKLEAKIKQIEWENSILKKATALLGSGQHETIDFIESLPREQGSVSQLCQLFSPP